MKKSFLTMVLLLCMCACVWGASLKETLSSAAAGDVIKIGFWEQDGNTENGKEAVEWVVISKTGSAAALIAKNALDVTAWNEGGDADRLENASVAAWLKSLAAEFSEEEKALTAVLTLPGRDFVSLMDEEQLKCSPTPYAKAKRPETASSTGCVSWWLADKGALPGTAAYITGLGKLQQKGINCARGDFAVRPCLILSSDGSTDTIKTLAKAAEDRSLSRRLSEAEPGETVAFGVWEQDGNTENGSEPIEWILAYKKDRKAYLISRHVLDYMPYDSSGNMVSWEESSLRKWLQGEFKNKAFEDWEQELLHASEVDASGTIYENGNPLRSLDGGENTLDKVFLVSLSESWDIPAEFKKAAPTALAKSKGIPEEDGFAPWWLRSPRNTGVQADHMGPWGNTVCGDTALENSVEMCGVRPVIAITVAGNTYDLAAEAFKKEDWTSAFALFCQAGDYKDSRPRAYKAFENLLKKAETGDIIYFGSFEQDKNESNGREAIEWYVLKFKDYVQLVSVYGLEARRFSDSEQGASWDKSSLREYLNGDFLSSSFALAEQDLISSWGIPAGKGKSSATWGEDTQDKIYILSADEIKNLFSGESARKCFACADKERTSPCPYWVRSPGNAKNKVSYVDAKGKTNTSGAVATEEGYWVRPSLYVWMKGVEPSEQKGKSGKNDSGIKMPDVGGTIINSVISHIIGSLF